jgi:hypothetical protein
MFRDEYHVETKRGTETAEGVEIFSYTVDLPVPTAPDSQRVRYHVGLCSDAVHRIERT